MTTNVWISCKKAQVAADNVIRKLLSSNWSVSSTGEGDMVHGAFDDCIQIAALEMAGTPKNGNSKFTQWLVSILRDSPIEDFSIVVRTFDGVSGTTVWNVGQGIKPIKKSNLQKKKLEVMIATLASEDDKDPKEKDIEDKPAEKEEKEEEKEAKPKDKGTFDRIMDGNDEEDEDVSCKLSSSELRVIQRVMASSVKLSEVFFADDVKTRQSTLKIINKVLEKP
jgi:hypothetical protein